MMYEELVKRLRNRRICIQQSGSLEDYPLLKEAADAIEELIKMPVPTRPLFLCCNCNEKIEREDCAHYDEEQDMGSHIPYCRLYKRSGYCPCLGCEKYKRKEVPLPKPPKEDGND